MIPRKRLDFSLYCALRFCLNLLTNTDTKAQNKLKFLFSEDSRIGLPFLSVRSALDATLTALALPPQTEVLVSAVTIPDMIRVIEEHGLIPVAIDIDKDTLAPLIDDAKKKLTANTKIFIFAHLFGSISDLTPLAQFCQTNNIFLIEDCAQAFMGPEYLGHPGSDLVLWSFGPLKTATALLGAMATFSAHHTNLIKKINAVCATWPVYSRHDYGVRIFKYSLLHIFSQPIIYSIFVYILKLFNKNIDTFISKTTRSFPKDKLFSFVRKQPNAALVRSMAWRLSTYPLWRVESREQNGEARIAQLALSTQVPGEKTIRRTFWLFPLCTPAVLSTTNDFRTNGIDASAASSSIICISPNSATETPQAHKLMQSIIYLPLDIPHHKNLEKNIAKVLTKNQTHQQSTNLYEHKEFNRVLVGYTTKNFKPTTKKELIAIIQDHIKNNNPFTVVGKAKSHAGHTILHGASQIDTTGVQKIHEPNIEQQEIVVEAGAIWRDVTRYLHTLGYSPLTTQSSNDFTVGGSVAGGIHGRSLRASHIADAVVSIEYIDRTTGAVATATPADPMFKFLVAGQGWFGVITEVTFKIVPNRLFTAVVKKISTAEIPTLLATLLQQPEEIFFMARPLIGPDYTFTKAIAYTWKEQPHTTATMPLYDTEQNVIRDRIIFRISLLWHYLIVWRNQLEGRLGLATNGHTYMRNALMCPPVTPLAFLENNGNKRREQVQEFFVPISRFDDLRQLLPGLWKKNQIRIAGMTFRFVKKNNRALLSSSGNSDMIACMLYLSTPNTYGAMTNLYNFIREATDMAIHLGGVPYLAYAFQQNPKQLLQAYPPLKELAQTTSAQSKFLTRLKSYTGNDKQ